MEKPDKIWILKFYRNCWIYLRESERKNIKEIIEILKKEGSNGATTGVIYGGDYLREQGKKNAIGHLLICRVIKVSQKHTARIYRLNPDWEKQLERHLKIIDKRGFT